MAIIRNVYTQKGITMKKGFILLTLVAFTQTPLLAMDQRVEALRRHSRASKLDRRLLSRLAVDTHLSDKHKTQAFFNCAAAIPKPTAIALLTLVLAGEAAGLCVFADCYRNGGSATTLPGGSGSGSSADISDGRLAYAQHYAYLNAERDRSAADQRHLMDQARHFQELGRLQGYR
jgi:hypothetical protein